MNRFDALFFKRFWQVLRITFPQFRSITVLLFISLLAIVLLEQYVIYNVGMIPSKFYRVLGEKDWDGFRLHMAIAFGIIVAIAVVRSSKKYMCSVFYVTTRGILTKHLHTGYFTDIVYYQINVLDDSTDNPDQRISQDVERMCRTFSEIIADLIISPFSIAYYSYYTWTSTGYIGPLSVLIYFLVFTIVNKFLMSSVVLLVCEQEQLEGDFRYKHMELRSNAESAAFYRCGQFERLKIEEKLDRLLSTQQRLNFRQFILTLWMSLADYIGSIVSYIMLAIPIFSGVYDGLSSAQLSELISKNAFATIYLIFCFTKLIDMAGQVSNIAGTTHRIVELAERIDQLKRNLVTYCNIAQSNDGNQHSGPGDYISNDGEIVTYMFHDVSFGAPGSNEAFLIKSLYLELKQHENVLITGDSGCGKSSLLRILDGLWTPAKGRVSRFVDRSSRTVLYLPQKPYLTNGTLRQQISFPYKEISATGLAYFQFVARTPNLIEFGCSVQKYADFSERVPSDVELLGYIKELDLEGLLERVHGLDYPCNWIWLVAVGAHRNVLVYDMLSPGEMQRIGFLRIFYHQPIVAVLDEATSQVSLEMEKKLYRLCQSLDVTVVSVGHRDSLRQFHNVELRLTGNGCWTKLITSNGASELDVVPIQIKNNNYGIFDSGRRKNGMLQPQGSVEREEENEESSML